MSVNKTARPVAYLVGTRPVINEDLGAYLAEELRKIANAMKDARELLPQEATTAPDNPRPGMIRYSRDPWRPVGGVVDLMVYWDGTAWQAV